MKMIDIIRIAIGNLSRNRLRTLLTISGVVVGVGAIVFLVSLGFGLQKLALEKIVNLEALKVITVSPGSKLDVFLNSQTAQEFQNIENVEAVSPVKRSVANINIGDAKTEQVMYGVKPEFLALENIKITRGTALSGKNENEAVVSKEVVTNLGLKQDILNKSITVRTIGADSKNIENMTIKVVGISDEKGVYVPYDTIKDGEDNLSSVKVKVSDKQYVPNVKKSIESLGFNTSVIKDQSASVNQIFYIIKIVLGGFGMIAFFVAAIGIFNTMTISLLERTHEIGVMKAIGGYDKNIAMIFITESSLIGLFGGIFGLTAGWLGGVALTSIINLLATQSGGEAVSLFNIPLYFSLGTVFFSCFISTVAGIWPARRAAKLNPLEALRYE